MAMRKVSDAVRQIYSHARASNDGHRCMVSPHPDLLNRMQNEVMATLRGRADLGVMSGMLRVGEPNRLGFNDGLLVPPGNFPMATPPSVIRNVALNRAPLRGTVRVAVVLVDFADRQFDGQSSAAHFEQLFFSRGEVPTGSVREYFLDVTNGLVDIQGQVVGPLRLQRTLTQYANGASGIGDARPNAGTMARDTALAADPEINFTPFDNDSDGYVDAFVIVHAGPGAEETGNPNHIWSHKWVLDGGELSIDATRIFAYLTVPEDARIGVCCHELGHLLFGFPDLYDTDGSSNGVGNWCLMGGGSWGNGGLTPVHPSAWCKAIQGWATARNSTSTGMLTIADVKTSRTVYKLWKDGAASREYFLMENRQRSGFDAHLPGDGLLIWHIDENVSTNMNESHYKVGLMQADGRRDLEKHPALGNRGDAGDAYPGTNSNRKFNNTSNPSSKAYNGRATSVSVTQISNPGQVMRARVSVRQSVPAAPPAAVQLDELAGRVLALEGIVSGLQAASSGVALFGDNGAAFESDGLLDEQRIPMFAETRGIAVQSNSPYHTVS